MANSRPAEKNAFVAYLKACFASADPAVQDAIATMRKRIFLIPKTNEAKEQQEKGSAANASQIEGYLTRVFDDFPLKCNHQRPLGLSERSNLRFAYKKIYDGIKLTDPLTPPDPQDLTVEFKENVQHFLVLAIQTACRQLLTQDGNSIKPEILKYIPFHEINDILTRHDLQKIRDLRERIIFSYFMALIDRYCSNLFKAINDKIMQEIEQKNPAKEPRKFDSESVYANKEYTLAQLNNAKISHLGSLFKFQLYRETKPKSGVYYFTSFFRNAIKAFINSPGMQIEQFVEQFKKYTPLQVKNFVQHDLKLSAQSELNKKLSSQENWKNKKVPLLTVDRLNFWLDITDYYLKNNDIEYADMVFIGIKEILLPIQTKYEVSQEKNKDELYPVSLIKKFVEIDKTLEEKKFRQAPIQDPLLQQLLLSKTNAAVTHAVAYHMADLGETAIKKPDEKAERESLTAKEELPPPSTATLLKDLQEKFPATGKAHTYLEALHTAAIADEPKPGLFEEPKEGPAPPSTPSPSPQTMQTLTTPTKSSGKLFDTKSSTPSTTPTHPKTPFRSPGGAGPAPTH